MNIPTGFYSFYDQFGSNYGSFELWHFTGLVPYVPGIGEPEPGWYWTSRFPGKEADARPEGPFTTALEALTDASPLHPLVEEAFASGAFPIGQAEPPEAETLAPACQDGAKAEIGSAPNFASMAEERRYNAYVAAAKELFPDPAVWCAVNKVEEGGSDENS